MPFRRSKTAAAVIAFILVLTSAGASTTRGSGEPSAVRSVLAVANSYDGTVTLIDAHTLRRLGPALNVIPDGDTPRNPTQAALYPAIIARQGEHNFAQDLQISPDGRVLYVSRGYLGDVAAFSLRTRGLLWRVQVPALRADHLILSPDGHRLFVTALPGNRVYAFDTRTHRLAGSYPAGDYPHVLELSPDGRQLFSGSLGNQLAPYGQDHGVHQLTVADPRTLAVLRTYRFGAGVRPFAFAGGGGRLVVQLSYLNGFEVLDLPSGRVVRVVRLPKRGPGVTLAPANYPQKAAHHGIAVSGTTVCDAATISNYAALVSLRTGHIVHIVPVGQGPGDAIIGPAGRLCFLTNRGSTALQRRRLTNATGDNVSAIDFRTGRELARIPVGEHPQAEIIARVPEAVLRTGRFLPASH